MKKYYYYANLKAVHCDSIDEAIRKINANADLYGDVEIYDKKGILCEIVEKPENEYKSYYMIGRGAA